MHELINYKHSLLLQYFLTACPFFGAGQERSGADSGCGVTEATARSFPKASERSSVVPYNIYSIYIIYTIY